MTVTLRIPGTPKPKGSLKCIGARGRGGHQLIEDHRPGQKEWRDRIANTVRTKVRTRYPRDVPVAVDVVFTLPRPKSHYRTGRNAHMLRDTAPDWPTGQRTGDTDKLFRLLGDALEDGGLVADDAQIVAVTAVKVYLGGPGALPYPGAEITITPRKDPH